MSTLSPFYLNTYKLLPFRVNDPLNRGGVDSVRRTLDWMGGSGLIQPVPTTSKFRGKSPGKEFGFNPWTGNTQAV